MEEAERGARAVLDQMQTIGVNYSLALATLTGVAADNERWQEVRDLTESIGVRKRTAPAFAESELRMFRAMALRALGQPDAACTAIREARERILRIAATLDESPMRTAYLRDFEPNVRTLRLAQEWLGDDSGSGG